MKPWRKQFGLWVPNRSLADNRGFISPAIVGAVAGSRRRTAASTDFTETWTGSDGAAWDSSRWPTITTPSSSVIDIQSNSGRISPGGGSYVTAYAVASFTAVTDMTILVAITPKTMSESYPAVDIRYVNSSNCYQFYGNVGSTNGYLYKVVSGSGSVMASSSSGWINSTAKRWIKLQVSGTTIRVKVWADGGSEPGSWTISTTDSSISSAGVARMSATNGGSSAAREFWYDDLTITFP